MNTNAAVEVDRRSRRRQETIDEILDVALELMAADGVAALSLSAVARRVGMQPPSLYQYFGSKMAIYDALFQRGAEAVLAVQRAVRATVSDPAREREVVITAFCRWCVENPVYSQLLFWRTVPGFEPSAAAFAPMVTMVADGRAELRSSVDAGQLHPDAASDQGIDLFTSLVAGLLSQQLANDPDASFEDGRYMRLLPTVLEMFDERYRPRGKP